MKTGKNLFQLMIDPQNMREAVRLAAHDKGDMPAVRKAMANPEIFIEKLIYKLENDKGRPPQHERYLIRDGIKAKPRNIVKPTYEEQVVHHAIILTMKPIFMKGMYEYSCGSIPNRGASYGKKYLEKGIKKNPEKCKFSFKMDIHHFFQSIDQEKLIIMLKKVIKDDKMLHLLELIIRCEKDPETNTGIPIGFYTSQGLSNYYLQGLDHYIKEELKACCYVRYMDDIVILGPSKIKLHKMQEKIDEYLKSLHLQMKNDGQVFAFEHKKNNGKIVGRSLDFMGFVFHYNRTVLRRSIYFRATRKANRMRKRKVNGYSSCQMLSYCGYLKQANCYQAFQDSIKPYINPRTLKKIVSNHDRRKNVQTKGVLWGETQGYGDYTYLYFCS